MKDKVFIDTNIWIYLYTNDKNAHFAKKIIESNFQNIIISTQVLNEFFNVIAHKYRLKSKNDTKDIIESLIENFTVSIVDQSIIINAIDISIKYQLNYFDSLMISSALVENCEVFYTEDMHNGLVIEESLVIKNPFKK